ncbi:MAG: hypothetical protein JST83_11770 [Bacteroidetes bacterium]|nr:hypothetical protein [Bacteroidota bacterium]
MLPEILRVFVGQNIRPCLDQDTRREFYIDDPLSGQAYIVKYSFHPELRELLFKVQKDDDRIVHLLAIDGCLIGRARQMDRCDFVLFDSTTVCFVEMKMRSEIEDEGELGARDTRTKAARQIVATFEYFTNQFAAAGIAFSYPSIEAIIAVPEKFPKSNSSERIFAEKFLNSNRIPLYIDSKKVFE